MALQPARPAAAHSVQFIAVLELSDVLAEGVANVVAQTVVQHGARAPARVEGIEGTFDFEVLRIAVVGIGICDVELHEAVPEMRVAEGEEQHLPVDVVLPFEGDALSAAEQVVLLQLHTEGVLATLAGEADSRVQGPHVARAHLEVDRPAVESHGHDAGVVEEVVAAQDSFTFEHQSVAVRFAGLEQELLADDRGPGLDVQGVGGTIEPAALARDGRVEDVARDDVDAPDHGTQGLELLRRRDGLSRSRTRHRRNHCKGQQQGGQPRGEPAAPTRNAESRPGTYGIRTVEPIVRRPSRSRWACATSSRA